MPRRLVWSVKLGIMFATVYVGTACSVVEQPNGSPHSVAPPIAEVSDQHSCFSTEVLTSLGITAASTETQPRSPKPGRIPESSTPVELVECNAVVQADYQIAKVQETRYGGDLSEVLSELDKPSEARDFNCQAGTVPRPVIWLLSDQGAAIRPSIPQDRCGISRTQVYGAISDLPEISSAERLIEIIPN